MALFTRLALAAGLWPAWPSQGGDFPALVWADEATDAALVEALADQFGGRVLRRGEAEPERGAYLVFNAAGREDLHPPSDDARAQARHARWIESRDDRELVREPCWSQAQTRERLQATLARSLELRRGADPARLWGISLGDEVSLTVSGGPQDLCLCGACQSRWRAWRARLFEREPELAPLAGERLEDHATDRALSAWEARDARALAGWILRRRFHRDETCALLEELAEAGRCLAPERAFGLLGLAGETAFGNVPVERALAWADFVEPYRAQDAWELCFSMRGERQRALATVFVEQGPVDRAAWQAWRAALQGADGLVLWSSESLLQEVAASQRLASALEAIRAVRARLGPWRPEASGVALLHSFDAACANWLEDALLDGASWPRRSNAYHQRNGTRERSLAGWIALFEDLGLLPGALPIEEVEQADERGVRLLVASQVSVLGAEQERGLVRFLERGGHLLIQGPFAQFDRLGRRRADDLAELWAARFPAQVARTQRDPAEYAELRLYGLEVSRDWHALARRTAQAAGCRAPPWRPAAWDERFPWLVAGRSESEHAWTVWALPNWRRERRASLEELALDLELEDGWRAEWIHPAPDARTTGGIHLAPGDAAVLRLERRR